MLCTIILLYAIRDFMSNPRLLHMNRNLNHKSGYFLIIHFNKLISESF